MKDIFIDRQNNLLRIAIRANDKLTECYIEEDCEEPYPGQIYKGIVKNIVPAIKCAFIDIGYRKNCYMYMDKKFHNTNIKKGEEVIVQIVKEDMGSKGPKVTNAVDVPGRYCVLITLNNNIEFSKKIEDKEYKNNLLQNIKKPADVGVLIRTNAVNVDYNKINKEIEHLYNEYKELERKAQYSIKPCMVYEGGGILSKILRDKLDENTSKIYVDNEEDLEYVNDFIKSMEDIDVWVELHDEDRALFDFYDIEKEILSLRNSKVMLPCGGYIVIDRTEAMHVIDVNSGKNVKSNSIRKTALITNLQAAEEAARQIKVRNLSGIIVIDFIDMEHIDDKNKVLQKLKEGFEADKSKTVIYPFTELNLVQIGRRRIGRPIYEFMEEDCMHCGGKGKRLKLSYLSNLIRNEIIRIDRQNNIKDIHIEIDKDYKEDINGDIINFIKSIDAVHKTIYLNYISDGDYYRIEPLIFANQIQNLQAYRVYG